MLDMMKADGVVVGVALSGGKDSVSLLHYLKSQGIRLIAINVEHGIRGEESLADSAFVKELCASWDVPCLAFSVDAPAFSRERGYTLEQGARILRYEIFDSVLRERKCDYIALAHHLDDQIETVLMRIFRGTGIKGLVGMRQIGGRYLRPFLGVSRRDIDDYAEENSLEFRQDSTNDDVAYTRNFLRGEIATIKTRFPALGESIKRLCASAEESENFIAAYVPETQLKDGEVYIKTSDCANEAIFKRLVLNGAAALGVRQDIEERHLKIALSLAMTQSGKYAELPHGLSLHRQGEYLVLSRLDKPSEEEEIEFGVGDFPAFGINVSLIEGQDIPLDLKHKDALYLAADSVPCGAVIRRRRDGDKIEKFGGGSKSLGDFLTDKKVPLRKRDRIAVIAVGSDVLAAAGIDISRRCAVGKNCKAAYVVRLL